MNDQAAHASRHVAGCVDGANTYPYPDAATAWMAADALLLHWRNACGAIGEQQNWLAQ